MLYLLMGDPFEAGTFQLIVIPVQAAVRMGVGAEGARGGV